MSAIPADRYGEGLNLAFDYDPTVYTPVVGDRVRIAAARKVEGLTQIGDPNEIGEVISIRDSLSEVVVRVDGIHDIPADDSKARIAGESVSAGPGVFGPGNKVYQYQPATAARHDGTTTGVKTIVVDTSDTVKIAVGGGSPQTITLTAGVGVTMAAISDEINAALTGAHTEVDSGGHIDLVCDDIFKTVEVVAVADGAYTLLGWTAGVYTPTAPNCDPSLCDHVMILVGGAKDAAIETLEE